MVSKRRRFAASRRAAGYSQEELAERLGVERTTVTCWEAGETTPQPWLRPKIAGWLGVSLEELAALLTEPLSTVDAGSSIRLAIPVATRATRADPATVGQIAGQISVIAKQYEAHPSASLLPAAGHCHAAVTALLDQSATDRVRRQLHSVATASTTLMSQLVWDASQRRDSRATLAYCADAIGHAQEAGDVVAAAEAELRKAYVALYGLAGGRDPGAGLRAAQTAAEHSSPVSQAMHGLALLHIGEAFAMLSEYRQCERALADAEAALDRIVPDDPAAGCFTLTQFGRLVGSCYLFLGHPERAEPYLSSTADQLRDRPKTRSLVLGNLSLAYLRQRRLDAATVTLHAAIDLLGYSRGGAGMAVVFGAARELYPWRREPAVLDIQDRLLALMALS